MNNKQLLLVWFLLVVGATVIVIIVSLFVVKLPDPWNWLVPLAFLVLTNIVGFPADILGIRSALFGEKPAPESVTEVEDSHDVIVGEKTIYGDEIKPTISGVTGGVAVAKHLILTGNVDHILIERDRPTSAPELLFTVPLMRNPDFVGREEDLE